METWKAESQPGKQMTMLLVCVLLGVLLVIKFQDFSGLGTTNSLAGFLLGVLLLLIGVVGVLFTGKQTIVIDPSARTITVEDKTRLTAKKRLIAFSDIVHVGIGYLGKRSNFVNFYFLVLKLRSGEEYSLFAPGRFYAGGSNRAVVESWQSRLQEYLGQQGMRAPAFREGIFLIAGGTQFPYIS